MREESEIEGDSKIFYLFSKFYAINETPYDLNLSFGYYHEKKRIMVPGQTNDRLQGYFILSLFRYYFYLKQQIVSREIKIFFWVFPPNFFSSPSTAIFNLHQEKLT